MAGKIIDSDDLSSGEWFDGGRYAATLGGLIAASVFAAVAATRFLPERFPFRPSVVEWSIFLAGATCLAAYVQVLCSFAMSFFDGSSSVRLALCGSFATALWPFICCYLAVRVAGIQVSHQLVGRLAIVPIAALGVQLVSWKIAAVAGRLDDSA